MPYFVDSSWKCLLLKPEPILNHLLDLDFVIACACMCDSQKNVKIPSGNQDGKSKASKIWTFCTTHPRIPRQDCSRIFLSSTSMDAAVHVHVKAWDTLTWTQEIEKYLGSFSVSEMWLECQKLAENL